MSQEILKKLDEMEGRISGRLDQVETNVRWMRDNNVTRDDLKSYATKRELDAAMSTIDPSLRKSSFWKKAGKEALRGGIIVLVGAGLRWVFSPSKKAKELAPTAEPQIVPPGTRPRTEIARA